MVKETTLASYRSNCEDDVRVSVSYGRMLANTIVIKTLEDGSWQSTFDRPGYYDRKERGIRVPVHKLNIYSNRDLFESLDIPSKYTLPVLTRALSELEKSCAEPADVAEILGMIVDSETIDENAAPAFR